MSQTNQNDELYRVRSSHGILYTDDTGKIINVDLDGCEECLSFGNTKTSCNIASFDFDAFQEDFKIPVPKDVDILDLEWRFKDGQIHIPALLNKFRHLKQNEELK